MINTHYYKITASYKGGLVFLTFNLDAVNKKQAYIFGNRAAIEFDRLKSDYYTNHLGSPGKPHQIIVKVERY